MLVVSDEVFLSFDLPWTWQSFLSCKLIMDVEYTMLCGYWYKKHIFEYTDGSPT